MASPTPSLEACDAELARLTSANDAIANTLVELDADSTRKLLATGPLRGVTAQRWQSAEAHIAELWTGRQLLSDVVATAAALRGRARRLSRDDLARYAAAVFGDSVELSSASIPLTQRALLGPTQLSTRCTPGQLLSAMESAFDDVRAVLADAFTAWQWQLSRLTGCENEQAALLAASPNPPTELGTVQSSLADLSAAISCDPLGTGSDAFAATEAALARARAASTSAEELKLELAAILAGGRQLLVETTALYDEACTLHAQAVEKIAGHPVQAPTAPDPTLADALDEMTALTGHVGAAASGRLLAWQQRAQSANAQARFDRDANQAPLSERTELRGRLDAYTAKAARYGLAESPQLARMATRARDLLFTAPCDLAAARTALAAYVNAVTASTTPGPGGHR